MSQRPETLEEEIIFQGSIVSVIYDRGAGLMSESPGHTDHHIRRYLNQVTLAQEEYVGHISVAQVGTAN